MDMGLLEDCDLIHIWRPPKTKAKILLRSSAGSERSVELVLLEMLLCECQQTDPNLEEQ